MNRQFFRMLLQNIGKQGNSKGGSYHVPSREPLKFIKCKITCIYLPSQESTRIYQEFLKLVMKYYTLSITEPLFMLRHLGLSLPHFCSTIKKVAGNTPLEVIASIILMDAKSRLKSTNEPVKNIASIFGFNNISFFNKFLSSILVLPLKEYRGH